MRETRITVGGKHLRIGGYMTHKHSFKRYRNAMQRTKKVGIEMTIKDGLQRKQKILKTRKESWPERAARLQAGGR